MIERRLSPDLPGLTTDQELVIYRVAQEALTNVLRHAQATRCVVELTAREGWIELSVSDDGVGLPADTGDGTIGIEGMRERALLVGGTLSISSAPGQGARVALQLPIQGGS